MVMSGSLANTANATLTAANISISSSVASAGLCLLRVVLQESGSATLTQACGTYQWGETQDYMVQVNGGATLQPVSGVVTYNNSANSPLSSVNVRLLTVPGGVQDAQTTTASNGTYSINAYTNGVRSFSLKHSPCNGRYQCNRCIAGESAFCEYPTADGFASKGCRCQCIEFGECLGCFGHHQAIFQCYCYLPCGGLGLRYGYGNDQRCSDHAEPQSHVLW